MQYCSWDMARNGCNCYFSFWTVFCPFTPLTTWKMKISKQWKKRVQMTSFYISAPKVMIIWYTVPEIWNMTDVTVFHFGIFFALLPPLTAQKIKISKKWKKTPGDIIILHMCTKNYDQMFGSLKMVCDGQMDGRTDEKSDT